MKILAVIAALAITPFVLAHPEHDPPTDHPGDSEHPDSDAVVDNSEVIENATKILTNVHNAYKNADAIQETITLTVPSYDGESEVITLHTTLAPAAGQIVVDEQMTATWVDDTLYLTISEFEDGYVVQENAEVFGDALVEATGGSMMPGFWTISFRESDDINDWLSAFSMGMPGTQVLGISSNTQEDGIEVDVIELTTMMGTVDVSVTKDSIIKDVTMTLVRPDGPSMELTAESNLSFVTDIPELTFDSTNLTKYDSIDEMFGEMPDEMPGEDEGSLVGKQAPDFTLSTLDASENVTLSSFKGSVVVLDFWATWCRPCIKGLPYLNEFTVWAEEQNLPVKVFAVNIEGGSNESARTKVEKFWAGKDYKMTVLIGSADKKLSDDYQIGGIPVTFVIAPDGTIIEHHVGYSDGMVDTLKALVAKALAPKDQPDHPE
jgi:thiol-disulfide isomerase/thioredoxin